MKAAIIYSKGDSPRYAEVPDPVVENKGQLLMLLKAAAIKNLDRSQARGEHYATRNAMDQAKVIGGDGVGLLEDSTRVYAIASGMIAEKALVDQDRIVRLPDGIDDATAAALPNAVIGSAMALRYRAIMKAGETVLINGATGFTGKMAVQVAKLYGAKKIIVTGRNERSLQALKKLGAAETVSLKQDNEAIVAQIKKIHQHTPIDVILDYLWGPTAECILAALKGDGSVTHRTRFVSIGAVTGDLIQLSAEVLRSVDLQLSGSGLGSWKKEEIRKLFSDILPAMFQLAADGKLTVDTLKVSLNDIEQVWQSELPDGKRIVVMI